MNVRLLVVQGRPAGKALRFGPGEYYLGRGPECHVHFKSDWVSRQHCLLRVTDGLATLRDLGSRNGTLVNGQLVAEDQVLAEGDQLQIGPVVFEVQLERPAAPGPPVPAPEVFLPPGGEEDSKTSPLDSTQHHPPVPPPPEGGNPRV